MKLRGLLHRKITQKKPPTPEQQAYREAYKKEYEKQLRVRMDRQEAAGMQRAQAKAKRDAEKAMTPRSHRIVAVGAKLHEGLKKRAANMPDADEYARRMEKLSAAVTGPTKKKTVTKG